MAITVTLVHQTPNWLRYLVSFSAGAPLTADITCTGAATPDLQTDSLPGPIKALSKAVANGYGQFAAGALNQAQSRALWLSDWTTSPGNANTVTARCRITRRGALGSAMSVDANVSAGNPILTVTGVHDGGGGDYYLDVEVPQAAGATP